MNFEKLIQTALENGCEVSRNESLSSHTTFGIGGDASVFIELAPNAAVPVFSCINKEKLPFILLGRGSNILFSDKPHETAVIHMGKLCEDITIDGNIITAYAGAKLSSVCTAARDNSLSGLEFAYGIPASVGGACYMNAGAYGGQMSDVLISVTACCPDGTIREFSVDEIGYSYRKSLFMNGGYAVLSAKIKLESGDRQMITDKMNELMQRRRDKQPLEYKSAGSTFKRPEGAFAGALIEGCGLKGYSCGDAQVSTKHAGFVVNTGSASYDDVMAVIDHVKKTVKAETGYALECEVEIYP